jgi:hypothetical protein
MSRTPARFTQAEVARTIRAAKQAGAGGVEVRPDGSMYVHLLPSHDGGKLANETDKHLEADGGAVL